MKTESMRIAVTNHAVDRYRERVPWAEGLMDESVRDIIRDRVSEGFENMMVREHPTVPDRRIIPFKAGSSILYFSLGPNTTRVAADVAVIGVLYEKELGRTDLGITLGQALPELTTIEVRRHAPDYLVRIGLESYEVYDDLELKDLLQRRQPNPRDVRLYVLRK